MRILFFVFFSFSLFSSEFMTWRYQGKKINISIEKFQGSHVNDKCSANFKSCMALKKLKKPYLKWDSSTRKEFTTLTSSYCKALEGSLVILKDSTKSDNEFCLFSDMSMVSASDLVKSYMTEKKLREVASIKKVNK